MNNFVILKKDLFGTISLLTIVLMLVGFVVAFGQTANYDIPFDLNQQKDLANFLGYSSTEEAAVAFDKNPNALKEKVLEFMSKNRESFPQYGEYNNLVVVADKSKVDLNATDETVFQEAKDFALALSADKKAEFGLTDKDIKTQENKFDAVHKLESAGSIETTIGDHTYTFNSQNFNETMAKAVADGNDFSNVASNFTNATFLKADKIGLGDTVRKNFNFDIEGASKQFQNSLNAIQAQDMPFSSTGFSPPGTITAPSLNGSFPQGVPFNNTGSFPPGFTPPENQNSNFQGQNGLFGGRPQNNNNNQSNNFVGAPVQNDGQDNEGDFFSGGNFTKEEAQTQMSNEMNKFVTAGNLTQDQANQMIDLSGKMMSGNYNPSDAEQKFMSDVGSKMGFSGQNNGNFGGDNQYTGNDHGYPRPLPPGTAVDFTHGGVPYTIDHPMSADDMAKMAAGGAPGANVTGFVMTPKMIEDAKNYPTSNAGSGLFGNFSGSGQNYQSSWTFNPADVKNWTQVMSDTAMSGRSTADQVFMNSLPAEEAAKYMQGTWTPPAGMTMPAGMPTDYVMPTGYVMPAGMTMPAGYTMPSMPSGGYTMPSGSMPPMGSTPPASLFEIFRSWLGL